MLTHYFKLYKDGKEYNVETKAGAYEMYDSLGRSDVKIERHAFDNGKHWVWDVTKIYRRTYQSGEVRYYVKLSESRLVSGSLTADPIIFEISVYNGKFDICTTNPEGKPYNEHDVPQGLLFFKMNQISFAVNNTLKTGCAFTIE